MQLERSCFRLQLSFLRNFYELFLSSACIFEIQLLVEAMSSPKMGIIRLLYWIVTLANLRLPT